MVKASKVLDRVLVLEMVRVTESAAISASKLIGRGDEKAADAAAVEAMRAALITAGIAYTIDDVPLTGRRQIFFRDPAGNGVELNFAMEAP